MVDYGYGITADSAGQAYVTGQTASVNFPSVNAFQPTNHGGSDAFITKFTAAGAPVYSSFLGGGSDEGGLSVALDPARNVYVTGFTRSIDYPTVNPIQSDYGGAPADAFIAKIVEVGPAPSAVVSRKIHGAAGTFDVALPLTGVAGIECRSGGMQNDYQIVWTFPGAVTFNSAAVTSGSGNVASTNSSADGREVTVNLTGVANAQSITVTLFGVKNTTTNGNVSVSMGVLVGDVNASKAVTNTDVAAIKTQVAAPVTSANFRNDVNTNGTISNTDVSTTKAQVGISLP